MSAHWSNKIIIINGHRITNILWLQPYLHKDLIHKDRANKYCPPEEKYYHVDPRITDDTLIYIPSSPEANLSRKEISGRGNPTLATVEKGIRLHEALVNNIHKLKSKSM